MTLPGRPRDTPLGKSLLPLANTLQPQVTKGPKKGYFINWLPVETRSSATEMRQKAMGRGAPLRPKGVSKAFLGERTPGALVPITKAGWNNQNNQNNQNNRNNRKKFAAGAVDGGLGLAGATTVDAHFARKTAAGRGGRVGAAIRQAIPSKDLAAGAARAIRTDRVLTGAGLGAAAAGGGAGYLAMRHSQKSLAKAFTHAQSGMESPVARVHTHTCTHCGDHHVCTITTGSDD
jgi:hypothetical protein